MSEDALKDFLRKQARSLDSLLELTPAKTMFGEDVSDQWQRKKQTPEQKKAARMAKLDPANWKSAKDVYDERSAEAAKKRKREQGDEGNVEVGAPEPELLSKKQKGNDSKPKPKPTESIAEVSDAAQIQNQNLKKKMKKRAHRAEKNRLRQEQDQGKDSKAQPEAETVQQDKTDKKSKADRPKSALKQQQQGESTSPQALDKSKSSTKIGKNNIGKKGTNKPAVTRPQHTGTLGKVEKENGEDEAAISDVEDKDEAAESADTSLEQVDSDAKPDSDDEDEDEDEEMQDAASTATSSEGIPEILSPPQDSAASSVSSILPTLNPQSSKQHLSPNTVTDNEPETTPATVIQSEADRQAARQRLQEQISQFRSQRKADDKPVRSRAELLAQRRQKEQERKTAKKEQRRKEKDEEAKRQDEEMAKRFSPGGSGSLLASPRSPMIDEGGGNAFTFGRIAFEDGTQFDPSSGTAAANKKHKGPQDPATALKAAQAKQTRVAGLDEDKKKTIEEQDMWLNARKRAHGERVRDDTSLLKKALKRQDKQKQRSEKDWDERVEGVRSSQEVKQKKRTENLQKRKDEKLANKSGKKKVKRPGFEGSFRGRTGKGKK